MKTFLKSFFTTILVIIILALAAFAGYFYFLGDEDENKSYKEGEDLQFLMLGVDYLSQEILTQI